MHDIGCNWSRYLFTDVSNNDTSRRTKDRTDGGLGEPSQSGNSARSPRQDTDCIV
jgi:hypothetical protein